MIQNPKDRKIKTCAVIHQNTKLLCSFDYWLELITSHSIVSFAFSYPALKCSRSHLGFPECHINVLSKQDSVTLNTQWMQCGIKLSHLCQGMVGTECCVLCEACVCLFVLAHIQSRLISPLLPPCLLSLYFINIILFILLYSYIHCLSDWANCSCSCIHCRFNYTPLWPSWNRGKKDGIIIIIKYSQGGKPETCELKVQENKAMRKQREAWEGRW